VDEQIIPFKGKHRFKQYVKYKPKKWGCKIFLVCDSHGIVYNTELYTGKEEHSFCLPDVGISGNVVIRLSQIISKQKVHKLYFDNWFTSVKLLVELEKQGTQCLGTVLLCFCNEQHKKDSKADAF
jgi:hypothetical protein